MPRGSCTLSLTAVRKTRLYVLLIVKLLSGLSVPERCGFEISYVRTAEGREVDFFAQRAGEHSLLVQVCLQSEGDETWDRELRALQAAARYTDQEEAREIMTA